jgi:myosin heavy subunit
MCQLIPTSLEHLGISNVNYYNYLNQSGCFKAEGTDDRQEFSETMVAFTYISPK